MKSEQKLDFDVSTKEGRIAWAAIIEMSTGFYSDNTPYEIIDRLEEVFNNCHPNGNNYSS